MRGVTQLAGLEFFPRFADGFDQRGATAFGEAFAHDVHQRLMLVFGQSLNRIKHLAAAFHG